MLDFREQLLALKTEINKEELNNNKLIESKTKEIVHSEVKINNVTKSVYKFENKINNTNDIKPKNKILVKRGQIFWADLGTNNQGSEQNGVRPILIIQNDIGNTYSPTTIVAVITSKMTKAKLPTHIELSKEIYESMQQDSVILFEQIRTLDKRRLRDKVCQLDEFIMHKIDKAIGTSLGVKVAEPDIELENKKNIIAENPLDKLSNKLRNIIEEKLDDIYTYEKALYKAQKESLRNNLLQQREAFLSSLQKFCEINNLNYRDYYKKYDPESETIAM